MSVVVVGLNHRTVPLALLERVTIDDARLPKALADVLSHDHVSEAVVLSTCNRTEVYVVAEKFHPAYGDLRTFFSELAFAAPEELADHLYVHDADAAAGHLFRSADRAQSRRNILTLPIPRFGSLRADIGAPLEARSRKKPRLRQPWK